MSCDVVVMLPYVGCSDGSSMNVYRPRRMVPTDHYIDKQESERDNRGQQ